MKPFADTHQSMSKIYIFLLFRIYKKKILDIQVMLIYGQGVFLSGLCQEAWLALPSGALLPLNSATQDEEIVFGTNSPTNRPRSRQVIFIF